MNRFHKILFILGVSGLLFGACVELFNVASGTGEAVGDFSLTWLALLVGFVLVCLGILAVLLLWAAGRFPAFLHPAILLRNQWFFMRGLAALIALAFPIGFLQYTHWGIVFDQPYLRVLLWVLSLLTAAFFISPADSGLGWKEFLAVLVVSSASLAVAVSLNGVTAYPFSMGWSEGNRLWDYSTLFGGSRYIVPEHESLYAFLDPERLWVGGLPFLLPGLTIAMARGWVGLTMILPYVLVGIAAYRSTREGNRLWFFVILWIFLFLKQGPIHAPLLLAAALTALAWRRSLWFSIPLMMYAAYFAQSSRFTWLFAPAIWIGMLEFGGASLEHGMLSVKIWVRSAFLVLAGAAGGYLMPKLRVLFQDPFRVVEDLESLGEQAAASGVSSDWLVYAMTDQPLLWYRLFPNATFENGILFGLFIAVAPLLAVLLWLVLSKKWILHIWQKLALTGSLLAFLVVGLVASTKIGGGGDLHNMDMFLIGLAFTAVIAWYQGGGQIIQRPEQLPVWVRVVLLLLVAVPALAPLRSMRAIFYSGSVEYLMTLTDKNGAGSLDVLPPQEVIQRSLEIIQDEADRARVEGEVLFIDQRQLLTFGYIQDVPLVVDYEKKLLMNHAMSANTAYFNEFYTDLERARFSLIVTEILREPEKDSTYEFGEENNAWVKWVSSPVLCYYEPEMTLREVGVQLLVPRQNPEDCAEILPEG